MAERTSIRHLGLIPDGNRRFAKERNQLPWWGHEKGVAKMREFFHWVFEDWQISVLTVYGLSSKNLSRPKIEVSKILHLIKWGLSDAKRTDQFMMENVRINFIGRTHLFPSAFQKALRSAERATEENDRFNLNIALAYDGHSEIADAVSGGARTEKEIEQATYIGRFPQPDLIIRTGGEKRLSGFLLWGSSYAELDFVSKMWPEFSREDLKKSVSGFERRNRRFGK